MDNFRFVLIGLAVFVVSACCIFNIFCLHKLYNTATETEESVKRLNNYRGHLIIQPSTIVDAGNGVFTTEDINEGEIIEICPVLLEDKTKFKESVFFDYVFNGSIIDGKADTCVFPLGYGTLYNHSDDPNCSHNIKYDKMIIKAKKIIPANSELFITYGDKWWETRAHKEKK